MKKIIACITMTVMLFTFTVNAEGISDWVRIEAGSEIVNWAEISVKDKSFTDNITKAEMSRLLLCACLKEGLAIDMTQPNPYSDLNDPVVLTAVGLGLAEGEEGEFFPDKEITRFEAAKYIYNFADLIFGFSDEDRALFYQQGSTVHDFEDYVPTEETAETVGFAVSWQILKGTAPNLLSLDQPCTIEQVLVMVSRCLE